MNRLEEFQTTVLNMLTKKSPDHAWTISTKIAPSGFVPRGVIYKDGIVAGGLYLDTCDEFINCYNITLDEIVDSIVNNLGE